MNKIIFQNLDDSIGIITPTSEALSFATIEQIAEKDVPHNLPYWIVPTSDIPESRTFRNAWQIDSSFGDPHGFGGESNEFDAELLRKYYEVRDADKN